MLIKDIIQMLKAEKIRVNGDQATIYAALQHLTPEEMVAPIADRLDDIDPNDPNLRIAKAHLVGFVVFAEKYMASRRT